MQICKTLSAGRWRFSVAYRKSSRRDDVRTRAAKQKHSSAAQRLLNRRMSHAALTGIIAANFADAPEARFVTLTFDAEHYDSDKKQTELENYALKEANLFIQRARRLTVRREQALHTVFVLGGGNNIRYHVHILTDVLTGSDIRALWDRGNANYHRLSDVQDDPYKWDFVTCAGNVDPAQIAGYMLENAAAGTSLGKHLWHASRNCQRAVVETTETIADREPIPRPENADIINEETKLTDYSEFRILEYIVPLPKSNNSLHYSRSA